MSERMTAAEVVAELRRIASDAQSTVLRGSDLQSRDEPYAALLQLPRLADTVEQHLTPKILDVPDGLEAAR